MCSRRRHVMRLLLCVYTLALLLGAHAEDAPSAPAPPSSPPSSSAQCEACRNYVECSRAYRGQPGKFCNDVLVSSTRVACCCPLSARCVWDETRCRCDEMVFGKYTPLAVVVGAAIYIFVTCRKYACPPRRDENHHRLNQTPIRRTPISERARVLAVDAARNYGSTAHSTNNGAADSV
jgi:hypothetical protein